MYLNIFQKKTLVHSSCLCFPNTLYEVKFSTINKINKITINY